MSESPRTAAPSSESPPGRSSSRPPVKGPDEYSAVLGMTPREHEAKMRKWYVMLAIALFFAVFGEGILMLTAKAKERREASAARETRAAGDTSAGRGASETAIPGGSPQR